MSKNKASGINWNLFYYFYEVAKSRSIKNAAKILNLNASTLSEHISKLEKQLNVNLFFRKHRRLELTPEGINLYRHATQMFEFGKQLAELVSPAAVHLHPVTIALAPGAASFQISEIIAKYMNSYGANIRLCHSHQGKLERGLQEIKYDFAFSCFPPDCAHLCYTKVLSSRLGFYVSTAMADVRFSELIRRQPLLLCRPVAKTRSPVETLLLEKGHQGLKVVSSEFPAMLYEICRRGQGIGVFNEDSINQFFLQRPFAKIHGPEGLPVLQEDLYLIWSKSSESTQAFRCLQDVLRYLKNPVIPAKKGEPISPY